MFSHDNWYGNHSLEELYPNLYAYSVNKDVSINSIMDGQLDGVQWSWNVRFIKRFSFLEIGVNEISFRFAVLKYPQEVSDQ